MLSGLQVSEGVSMETEAGRAGKDTAVPRPLDSGAEVDVACSRAAEAPGPMGGALSRRAGSWGDQSDFVWAKARPLPWAALRPRGGGSGRTTASASPVPRTPRPSIWQLWWTLPLRGAPRCLQAGTQRGLHCGLTRAPPAVPREAPHILGRPSCLHPASPHMWPPLAGGAVPGYRDVGVAAGTKLKRSHLRLWSGDSPT